MGAVVLDAPKLELGRYVLVVDGLEAIVVEFFWKEAELELVVVVVVVGGTVVLEEVLVEVVVAGGGVCDTRVPML